MDDAYLGGFAAVLIVVILAVIACIVVAIVWKKKKQSVATEVAFSGQYASDSDRSQYAILPSVKLPPPLPYDQVPEAQPSYDNVASAQLRNYDIGEIGQMQ